MDSDLISNSLKLNQEYLWSYWVNIYKQKKTQIKGFGLAMMETVSKSRRKKKCHSSKISWKIGDPCGEGSWQEMITRWAPQKIQRMHELGFFNDILRGLQSPNITQTRRWSITNWHKYRSSRSCDTMTSHGRINWEGNRNCKKTLDELVVCSLRIDTFIYRSMSA